MEWTERNWDAGTRVEVEMLATGERAVGVLVTRYTPDWAELPRIRLDSGRLVSGRTAHWIPTAEEINRVEDAVIAGSIGIAGTTSRAA